jgi:hypothetical protein
MNKKYERYIEYIANDLQPPYFENMKEMYGVSEKEYELVLSKVFNELVTIKGRDVYNANGDEIYYEDSDDYWEKREYNSNGDILYYENSRGYWSKSEYGTNGNETYYENSDGEIEDRR